MENSGLINLQGFPLTHINLDHVDINISGESCPDDHHGKCLPKAAKQTKLEDFEVFDERDLMNVIGYSMISIGKSFS